MSTGCQKERQRADSLGPTLDFSTIKERSSSFVDRVAKVVVGGAGLLSSTWKKCPYRYTDRVPNNIRVRDVFLVGGSSDLMAVPGFLCSVSLSVLFLTWMGDLGWETW